MLWSLDRHPDINRPKPNLRPYNSSLRILVACSLRSLECIWVVSCEQQQHHVHQSRTFSCSEVYKWLL